VPYNARNRKELAKVVAKREIKFPKKLKLSPCVKDLIKMMIVDGVTNFEQVWSHPFVESSEK